MLVLTERGGFHEKALARNGRGACSPEHRRVRTVRWQGQSPTAGGHEGLRGNGQAIRWGAIAAPTSGHARLQAFLKARSPDVQLRVSGCFSDSALGGGAVFCCRCEAENGDVQIRRGRPAAPRRGAQRLSQEVHGKQGRSARSGIGGGCRAEAMKHDPEKWLPVSRLREAQ